jgi:hypothetical protein
MGFSLIKERKYSWFLGGNKFVTIVNQVGSKGALCNCVSLFVLPSKREIIMGINNYTCFQEKQSILFLMFSTSFTFWSFYFF